MSLEGLEILKHTKPLLAELDRQKEKATRFRQERDKAIQRLTEATQMDGQGAALKQPEIYGALAKMISAVGIVGKNRKNAAQGYQFRGIDDVLSACQSVLAEHGVVCVPRVVEREREVIATKTGGSMASVRLLVDHTFFARDGSFVVCTTLGEAMDSGDKASNKAMSAALKYALVETLCIPTFEDDRDTETASPEMTAPRAPAQPPTAAPRPAAKPAQQAASSGGALLPNYGSLKGQPVVGQKLKDLEYYAGGCRKTLGDPAKSNWHAKEKVLLAAIEAEIARQSGGDTLQNNRGAFVELGDEHPPPPGDEDAPGEPF